jgi:hypothetical protein
MWTLRAYVERGPRPAVKPKLLDPTQMDVVLRWLLLTLHIQMDAVIRRILLRPHVQMDAEIEGGETILRSGSMF